MHTLMVLVLDDEPTMRALLARFLAAHGYQSAEAGTMSEALDVLRGTPLGAVILDVRLPAAGSGLDVLQRLREQPDLQSIPAIVLTGGVLTEDEELIITSQRAHLFYASSSKRQSDHRRASSRQSSTCSRGRRHRPSASRV